jgi:hypothetical protein
MVSPRRANHRRRAPVLPDYPRLRVGLESEDRFRIQEHQPVAEKTRSRAQVRASRNRVLTRSAAS